MPDAYACGSPYLDLFTIHDEVRRFRSEETLFDCHFRRIIREIDQRLIVGELDPNVLERKAPAVVLSFEGPHEANIEVIQNMDCADTDTRIVTVGPDGPMDSRKPQIAPAIKMPLAIVRSRWSNRRRSMKRLILTDWFVNLRCGRRRLILSLSGCAQEGR